MTTELAPEAAPPAGRPAGLLHRYRYPIAVWALSRVGVYLAIAVEGWTTRQPRHSGATWNAFFASLHDWDASWYAWIAEHGYEPSIGHGNTAAFFPLYPLVTKPFTWLPGPWFVWASLLSSLVFLAALCLLYRITAGRYDERMARRTVLYLAIFPLTFVFSLAYAESLFLLLVLAAFALTWYGRWWAGGVAAALAVLSRPTGVALLPALAWRLWRTGSRRPTEYAPLLLMPLAEVGFFGYLWWQTGDPLAHFHAQERGWSRGISVLPVVTAEAFWDAVAGGELRFLVHVSLTLLWCGLFYWAWKLRMPGEYLIFAALMILLPTSGGLLVSIGRFGMVAFPLFWALADLGRDERVDTVVRFIFPLMLATLIFVTFGARTFTP